MARYPGSWKPLSYISNVFVVAISKEGKSSPCYSIFSRSRRNHVWTWTQSTPVHASPPPSLKSQNRLLLSQQMSVQQNSVNVSPPQALPGLLIWVWTPPAVPQDLLVALVGCSLTLISISPTWALELTTSSSAQPRPVLWMTKGMNEWRNPTPWSAEPWQAGWEAA